MKQFCGPRFIIRMVVGTIVCTLVMSIGVMLLWNWLIPELFKGPQITYLHALGLLLLTKFLFGFGFKMGCSGQCGSGLHGAKGYWRKRWEDKLANMTPEEREKAKEKYKKCCGPWDKEEDSKCQE